MGNFYTNVSLRTTEREAVIAYMRANGRACFVSPTSSGFTTVYERLCDEQNLADLEALTGDLSSRFHCSAIAVLNHDDDILWMSLVRDGKRIETYDSSRMFSGNAWVLAREFQVIGLFPLLWFLMNWPFVLFEVWRHAAIAWVLGIPNFTVGFGFRYLARGERPSRETADGFVKV